MSVKIRLTRGGRKKSPFYHVIAADARSPRDGRFIEKLGYYNPLAAKDSENRLVWKEDRVAHWLSVGAEPTTAVARMIVEHKIGTDKERARLETVLNRRYKLIEARVAEAKAKADAEAKAAAEAEAAEKAAADAEAEKAAAAAAAAEAAPAEEAAAE